MPRLTNTSTPEPDNFPDWITDPKSLVLLAFNPISRDHISFADINSGEVYTSPINSFDTSLWINDHQIAVVFTDRLSVVDLRTGMTVDYIGQANIDQFWRDQAHRPRFVVDQDYSEDEDPVVVTDNTFSITFQLTDPADKIFDRQTALSPVEPHLAVLQSLIPPEPFLTAGETLKIYDLLSRTAIASFAGDFSQIEWSPSGQEILYRRESTSAHIENAPPCILNVSSGMSRCLYLVTRGHADDFTGAYHWSPNGKQVSFIYYASTSPKLTAGMCVFQLATGQITCPTTAIPELDGQAIIQGTWAPDSQHLLFIYDTSCPRCDYSDHPVLAAVAIDGSGFFAIGSDEWDYLPNSWRPTNGIP